MADCQVSVERHFSKSAWNRNIAGAESAAFFHGTIYNSIKPFFHVTEAGKSESKISKTKQNKTLSINLYFQVYKLIKHFITYHLQEKELNAHPKLKFHVIPLAPYVHVLTRD